MCGFVHGEILCWGRLSYVVKRPEWKQVTGGRRQTKRGSAPSGKITGRSSGRLARDWWLRDWLRISGNSSRSWHFLLGVPSHAWTQHTPDRLWLSTLIVRAMTQLDQRFLKEFPRETAKKQSEGERHA